MPKPSEYDKTHLRNMAAIGTRIDRIFKKAADEAAKIGVQIKELHPERLFSFDDYPETKKQIERLMAALQQSTETAIANGVRSAWTLSNNKNNALARRLFGERVASLSEEQARRYFSTNGAALDAFLQRREQGMDLSDRVWKYTNGFKEEIELGLDLGIRSGKPVAEMARDLRQYLQHPDMMFRRFRVREENGDGHRWKRRVTDTDTGKVRWENFNPRDFHPGRGVYRSSYKNARRLAVTETNIAYRTSDHLRWQQMDFVVGIRIVLSNNHTLNGVAFTDICDRLSSTKPGDGKGLYPKDFKFVGWHPHCRCHMESVLKTEAEMEADTQRILNGEPTKTDSVNKVRDTPAEYKQFAKEFNARNEERAAMGLSPLAAPYFVRDNRGYFDKALGIVQTKEITEVVDQLRKPKVKASKLVQEYLADPHKALDKYSAIHDAVEHWQEGMKSSDILMQLTENSEFTGDLYRAVTLSPEKFQQMRLALANNKADITQLMSRGDDHISWSKYDEFTRTYYGNPTERDPCRIIFHIKNTTVHGYDTTQCDLWGTKANGEIILSKHTRLKFIRGQKRHDNLGDYYEYFVEPINETKKVKITKPLRLRKPKP